MFARFAGVSPPVAGALCSVWLCEPHRFHPPARTFSRSLLRNNEVLLAAKCEDQLNQPNAQSHVTEGHKYLVSDMPSQL